MTNLKTLKLYSNKIVKIGSLRKHKFSNIEAIEV